MFIYGLANPDNDEVFYIGKAIDANKRYLENMRPANGHNNQALKTFIYRLIFKGMLPKIIILEECQDQEIDTREKYWINYGLENNWPLTNWNFGEASKEAGGKAQIDYRKWLNERIKSI